MAADSLSPDAIALLDVLVEALPEALPVETIRAELGAPMYRVRGTLRDLRLRGLVGYGGASGRAWYATDAAVEWAEREA